MKPILRSLVALSAVLCFAGTMLAAVESGQPAPDFTLTDIHGKTHRLADYRGKPVILEWHNPECPVVGKHYESRNIPQLQAEATAAGAVWLVVNSNRPGSQGADYSVEKTSDYLGRHGAAPSAYLRDPNGKVGKQYGAKTTPHVYLIDAQGTLVYQGAIDDTPGGSKKDLPKAKNYIRAGLAALKEGKPLADSATKPYGCGIKY